MTWRQLQETISNLPEEELDKTARVFHNNEGFTLNVVELCDLSDLCEPGEGPVIRVEE